jgi:hypothetical protein
MRDKDNGDIYLDLATETEIAQIRFCTLPDSTMNFSVTVSKETHYFDVSIIWPFWRNNLQLKALEVDLHADQGDG